MTRIVKINEHEGFRVIKSDIGDWYYTGLDISEGTYDLEMKNVNGRWWVTKATTPQPTDYKRLSKEFRERVKENNNGKGRNQSTPKEKGFRNFQQEGARFSSNNQKRI